MLQFLFYYFSGADCSQRADGAHGAPQSCGRTLSARRSWTRLDGSVRASGKLDKDGLTLRQAECHFHIKARADRIATFRWQPPLFLGAVGRAD